MPFLGAARLSVPLTAALLAGCDASETDARAPATLEPAPSIAAPPLPTFTDVAAEAGLVAENHTGRRDPKDWIVSAMGGGSIVLDYDQDGRMDLVVVDGTMLTEQGELEYHDDWRTRVWHNDGGMKFTDVTRRSGVDLQAFGFGGASCDYDGDGFPDFYVCCWGANRLYRNRGDGTFEDVTEKAGVAGGADDVSTGCCFGDVDGDGVPDLYVTNYVDQRAFIEKCRREGLPGRQYRWHGVLVWKGPAGLAGQTDRLYLADGAGGFRDATATNLGPETPPRNGFQSVMSDLDGDGDLDVYVANDLHSNLLWINDGRGRFADRALEAGVATDLDGLQQASMGLDVADVNRDGRLDVFVTNFSASDHNTLYVNKTLDPARPAFRDMSDAYNVKRPAFDRVSWGTKLLDYDCDGELDLFVACGHVYGEIADFEKATGSSYRERCLLERGVEPRGGRFEDVSARSGPAFDMKRAWRGAAFADFDDDGDLDVFVTALNDKPALFRNDGGNRNGFLVLRLVGEGKLRDPCGARVTVFLADGRPRLEELHHGISFCGDNDPRLFFGLGGEAAARRVEVRWPDGRTQSFADVPGRKFYVIEKGKDDLREEKR